MKKRTALIVVAAAALLTLLAAPEALAAAGGGSGGFGGGGGGGGGGGRGVGIYILIQLLIRIAILGHGIGALVLIGLIIAVVIVMHVFPGVKDFATATNTAPGRRGKAARRRVAQRERRVELAAAEAAEEDPAFAPEVVKPAAIRLFEDIETAWDQRDRATLNRLVGPKLSHEWERRLEDFDRRGWHNRVKLLGEPTVSYVGLNHRGDQGTNQVVVRIDAKLRDYVEDRLGHHINRTGKLSEITRIREYWTLSRRGNRWVLASIEQGSEGQHVLNEKIVATPWSDDDGLRDDALIEGAVADAVPETIKIAELADVDFARDGRAAALDLSLADGRFAPDVLEASARRAVRAWAAAVDGDDTELRTLAHPSAVTELLHPGDPSRRTRLVVRGPRIEEITIEALDAAAQPPTMTIALRITGRRYIQDRDTTAIVAGSQSRRTSFTERWTLALEGGDTAQPWRIASVDA